MPPDTYPSHPAASLFPLLSGPELEALAADIAANGLLQPVVLLDGQVLDGRNRLAACTLAGVEPRTVDWGGTGSPVAWVLSANLHRRHLSTSQRAAVAVDAMPLFEAEARARQVSNLRRGDASPLAQFCANGTETAALPRDAGKSAAAAAALSNVSPRSVESAAAVKRASPPLFDAVKAGTVPVTTAADLTVLSPEAIAALLSGPQAQILAAAKQIRQQRLDVRRADRLDRIAAIARGNTPLPSGMRYPVIYADPPWRYEHAESASREIEEHYLTMSLAEIKALDVSGLATDAAILFLWATSPKLAEAMAVVAAWGFTYRTCAVWDKQRIGMGYYFRQQHELLLVAPRGDMPAPPPATRPPSVVTAPRGRHSEKPAEVADMIERMYPALPRIELFARSPRPGWVAWGNEVAG